LFERISNLRKLYGNNDAVLLNVTAYKNLFAILKSLERVIGGPKA